jgi:hypothetical protein
MMAVGILPRRVLAVIVVVVGSVCSTVTPGWATDYEVGPETGMLGRISDVPWESLAPGDSVRIHWQATPYREKWVVCRRGTAAAPIVVSGVPGPGGELPVIDGRDAVTDTALDFWNQSRGVIKIGGASVPPDTLPAHIVIEKLEVRSGRPPYTFTNTDNDMESYASNAAAIYVEKAEHLVIRECILRDSGNGLFIGAYDGDTRNVVIEGNWIHDNGIVGSYYQHNTYTAAIHITYQFNRFGRLCDGCGGNNLKDRSAGLIVRYNWIEGGNRQLDLVDAEDSVVLVNHPAYGRTFVYGNVLIEPDDEGNSQIVHYGGDSGTTADYRKGTLHFFHNTVVSTRSGNTTLLRLSTNEEHADVRSNIVYVSAAGHHMAMLASAGMLDLRDNWLPSGWVASHSGLTGVIVDHGSNQVGTDPGFTDFASQSFAPVPDGSPCENAAGPLHADTLPLHEPDREYRRHRGVAPRIIHSARDLGTLGPVPETVLAGHCTLFFQPVEVLLDHVSLPVPEHRVRVGGGVEDRAPVDQLVDGGGLLEHLEQQLVALVDHVGEALEPELDPVGDDALVAGDDHPRFQLRHPPDRGEKEIDVALVLAVPRSKARKVDVGAENDAVVRLEEHVVVVGVARSVEALELDSAGVDDVAVVEMMVGLDLSDPGVLDQVEPGGGVVGAAVAAAHGLEPPEDVRPLDRAPDLGVGKGPQGRDVIRVGVADKYRVRAPAAGARDGRVGAEAGVEQQPHVAVGGQAVTEREAAVPGGLDKKQAGGDLAEVVAEVAHREVSLGVHPLRARRTSAPSDRRFSE